MFDYTFDENAIIYELRLEDSTQAVKDQIIQNIYERLYEHVRSRVFEQMTDEELKAFEKMPKEEANKWLTERFPDSATIFDEELRFIVSEMRAYLDAAQAGAQTIREHKDNK